MWLRNSEIVLRIRGLMDNLKASIHLFHIFFNLEVLDILKHGHYVLGSLGLER